MHADVLLAIDVSASLHLLPCTAMSCALLGSLFSVVPLQFPCQAGRVFSAFSPLYGISVPLTSDALRELRSFVPEAAPNPGFMRQLALFQDMGNVVDKTHPMYKAFRLSLGRHAFNCTGTSAASWVATGTVSLATRSLSLHSLSFFQVSACARCISVLP